MGGGCAASLPGGTNCTSVPGRPFRYGWETGRYPARLIWPWISSKACPLRKSSWGRNGVLSG